MVLDWEEGRTLIGATQKQMLFARALSMGANQTQSCVEAGYGGSRDALRGMGSKLARNRKILALLSWARQGGPQISDTPGDDAELHKILWRHARGKDRAHSIRASEVLHRLDQADRDRGATHEGDGLSEDRLARDCVLRGPWGVLAFAGLAGGFYNTAISRISLFWDIYPALQEHWPAVLAKFLERLSGEMKKDLDDRLADPKWQLWTRQKIWGEIGFVIDSRDNRARRDPQGRPFILPSAVQPTSDHGVKSAARPAPEAANGKGSGDGVEA